MAKTRYTYKYNGVVVRNSNNVYRYGLVNHLGGVIACSGTGKGALKNIAFPMKIAKKNLEYCQKNKPEKVAYYEQQLENLKKWHVVELEVVENL